MSEHEAHKPDDIVDRAAAALRDMPLPDGPPAQLLADTLSAIRAADHDGTHLSLTPNTSKRRFLTMRFATKFAVAAVLALVIGALVWTVDPLAGHAAFADVLEKVQQVHSVRFKAQVTFTPPGANKPTTVHMTVLHSGDQMRQDVSNQFTSIMDFKTGRVVTLIPPQKKAIVMRMENMPKRTQELNLLQSFRAMTPESGKSIGRKEIGGQTLDGYVVEKDGKTTTVWADPKTRLPVRMETRIDIPMAPKSDAVMTDFEWDLPADQVAMSMDVPAGYDVQEMTLNGARSTEKELIETLRGLATGNDGKFPDAFDFANASKIFQKAKSKLPKRPQQDKATIEQMTREAMAMMRGVVFVQKANGEDFHYAGKGVALGQAGRPIFWYRPTGSETYHVIDADLTVHTDVKPDDLPKVESQKLSAGAAMGMTTTTPAKGQ